MGERTWIPEAKVHKWSTERHVADSKIVLATLSMFSVISQQTYIGTVSPILQMNKLSSERLNDLSIST